MPQSTDWDPERYRRFESERTRPAIDLLSRVRRPRAGLVVDLGCGPGNSTELLVQRFPGARVIGVDTSPAMVAAARERLPHCRFVESDLTTWQPDEAPDVLFANAVLQWLPDTQRFCQHSSAALHPAAPLPCRCPTTSTLRRIVQCATSRWPARGLPEWQPL